MNTKILLFLLLFNITLLSCSKETNQKVDGYWQLTNISYPDGTVVQYDSIFYGFQHERLFSFTALKSSNSSSLSYGFVYFPSESEIQVSLDTLGYSSGTLVNIAPDFLERSTWKAYENTFSIVSLSEKKMELKDNEGKTYSLKKY